MSVIGQFLERADVEQCDIQIRINPSIKLDRPSMFNYDIIHGVGCGRGWGCIMNTIQMEAHEHKGGGGSQSQTESHLRGKTCLQDTAPPFKWIKEQADPRHPCNDGDERNEGQKLLPKPTEGAREGVTTNPRRRKNN